MSFRVWMCPTCGWGWVPPHTKRELGDYCAKGHAIVRCEPVEVAVVRGPEPQVEASKQ